MKTIKKIIMIGMCLPFCLSADPQETIVGSGDPEAPTDIVDDDIVVGLGSSNHETGSQTIADLEEKLRKTICKDLEHKFVHEGLIPLDERKSYCINKCDGNHIECPVRAGESVYPAGASKGDTVGDSETTVPKSEFDSVEEQLVFVICEELTNKYAARGFVTPDERRKICKYECTDIPIRCKDIQTQNNKKKTTNYVDDFKSWAGKLAADEVHMKDDVEAVSADMWATWDAVNEGGAGLILAVIPILLNQWKYYNFIGAGVLSFVFMVIHYFGSFAWGVTVHNIAIAAFCALLPAGSHVLTESIVALIIQLGLVASTFSTDPINQIAIFTIAVIGYFLYIYWCFFIRRQGATAGVVILILQAFVMMERVDYARKNFGLDSFAQVAFEMAFNSIVPKGKYTYFSKNAIVLAIKVIKYADVEADKHLQLSAAVMLQMIMLLAFRAGLGTFYIHTLRYKLDFGSIIRGLWVYMIDFFGPFQVAYNILFRYETANARRIMYSAVGCCLFYFEMRGALGLWNLRLICTGIDKIFIRSSEGRSMHYLEFNIDFMQAAFPQKGAPPYMSMKSLNDIAMNVGILFAQRYDEAKQKTRHSRGMGVVLCSAGRTMLYSVRHVVAGVNQVQFQEDTVSTPEFNPVSKGDDPIMAMKYTGNAVDVSLLTATEAYDVKQLVFINLIVNKKWEVLDRVICIVPDFSIHEGKLYATVNLRKGDSGGPCFSILGDGTIRFCGVVSQGNPRRGGGNIISICYAEDDISGNSSDDESVGHGKNHRQFNRVRRHEFASECPDETRFIAARRLNAVLNNHHITWEYAAARDGLNLSWKDMDCPLQAAEDFEKGDDVGVEDEDLDRDTKRDDDNDDGYDEGGDFGPGGGKNKRRRDAKRRNKDKAARKRNHYDHAMVCRILRDNLGYVYSELDAKNIYASVVTCGRVPYLEPDIYIAYGVHGQYVLDSVPPDPSLS